MSKQEKKTSKVLVVQDRFTIAISKRTWTRQEGMTGSTQVRNQSRVEAEQVHVLVSIPDTSHPPHFVVDIDSLSIPE